MSKWHQFSEFMDQVDKAKSELGLRPYQDCFYRGHLQSSYSLLPSLFRNGEKSFEEYWKLESRLFYEFRNRARLLYENIHSDWDVLFHMQHHGVPTRLLDWTTVFGVALYFAIRDYKPDLHETPCIWLMNPFALNHATWGRHRLFNPKYLARDEQANRTYDYGELLIDTHPWPGQEKLSWITPLAVVENQRSERMFAQDGWFTIQGTDLRPLNEIFAPGHKESLLRRVEIPREIIPVAHEFLPYAGIGHRQLFPDLDGLARSVKDTFGLSR